MNEGIQYEKCKELMKNLIGKTLWNKIILKPINLVKHLYIK